MEELHAKRAKVSTPSTLATPSPQPATKKLRNSAAEEAQDDQWAESMLLGNDAVLQRALASQIAASPKHPMSQASPLKVDGYETAFSPAKPVHLFPTPGKGTLQTPDKSFLEAETQVCPTPGKSIVEAETQVCPTPEKSTAKAHAQLHVTPDRSGDKGPASSMQVSPSPTMIESPVAWNDFSVCMHRACVCVCILVLHA